MVLHRRCTGKLKTFVSRDELKECLTTCGAALTETLAEGVDYEKTFPLAGIDGPQRVELGAHRTRTLTLTDNVPHGCIFTFTLPLSEVTLNE